MHVLNLALSATVIMTGLISSAILPNRDEAREQIEARSRLEVVLDDYIAPTLKPVKCTFNQVTVQQGSKVVDASHDSPLHRITSH